MAREQENLNISMIVTPEADRRYTCELSSDDSSSDKVSIRCEGESKEHAIANTLERLASQYRQAAEAKQKTDWTTIEKSSEGEAHSKYYHVILHYERTAEDVSKFEAMHNTIMGNTVVENAQISVIEIGEDVQVEPIVRQWDN
ncbi:MAG: hypothetical protein AAFN40_20340 [Cyanobacteria bacterium J06560_6]